MPSRIRRSGISWASLDSSSSSITSRSSRFLLASTRMASVVASSLYSAQSSAISSVLPRLDNASGVSFLDAAEEPFDLPLAPALTPPPPPPPPSMLPNDNAASTMSPPRMSIASASRHSNAHSISNCRVLIASSRDTMLTCSSSCRNSLAILARLGMSVLRTRFSRTLLASCSLLSSATMASFKYPTISPSFPTAFIMGNEICR